MGLVRSGGGMARYGPGLTWGWNGEVWAWSEVEVEWRGMGLVWSGGGTGRYGPGQKWGWDGESDIHFFLLTIVCPFFCNENLILLCSIPLPVRQLGFIPILKLGNERIISALFIIMPFRRLVIYY